ncbi:MAG: hypothetical protein BECKG1743D_GA0114223_100197 [Candidatus Kentron sp. G]|nr:MAG: hypothetical protein BECKG1743F_GA0114225_100216 [Candidatus Kentron sp. G]VFM95769.1 MAG: hypothetical protein BECKG1743E_GA0114224_100177 [Candidatus Kentron sp. G]VFM97570.1 MAG: hypothetical protein BECKG1743D_GA0114223_100197 [Candidatus Kentron sp. G]
MIWIGEYPSVFRGKRSKQGFILGVMKNFITNNQCIIIFCLQKLSFGCPGETSSHKNACKEFGLTEREIIEAMRTGKLQYRENYAHGNPYFRLLRNEVIALTIALRGENYLEKREIAYRIEKITKEVNSCKRKLKALEKERERLTKQQDHLGK